MQKKKNNSAFVIKIHKTKSLGSIDYTVKLATKEFDCSSKVKSGKRKQTKHRK